MARQPFSERHGFAPEPQPLAYDELPDWVREEFLYMAQRLGESYSRRQYRYEEFTNGLYQVLRPYISEVLARSAPNSPPGGPWNYYIPTVVQQCDWWQFYDICERVCEFFWLRFDPKSVLEKVLDLGKVFELPSDHRAPVNASQAFSEEMNSVFSRAGLAWRFKNGLIEREYSQPVSDTLEKTHTLLKDPRFTGPDEQFKKAIAFLSQRPEPDTFNCAKDAVGALEGVALIISEKSTGTLSSLLNQPPLNQIPPTLKGVLDKLYAYRGATPGVAHGQVGTAAPSMEEAEFVLSTSASAIVYLVKRFPLP